MALKISGTRFDAEMFEFSATSLAKAKTEWTTYVNNINTEKTLLPSYLDIVYSGNLMLVYLRWKFDLKDDSPVPGAVGVTYNGENVTFKYNVTSSEYTTSVFNNSYVALLSKTRYSPTVKNYKGFYLTKVYYDKDKSVAGEFGTVSDFDSLMDYYNNSDVKIGEPKSKFEFVKLSYIYDNNLYTFATMCNALADISGKFTFAMTETVLKIYFSVKYKSDFKHIEFMPLICSFDKINTFNEEYFSEDLTYYCDAISNKFDEYDCIEQSIDMTKTATDSVKLTGIHSQMLKDQYYDIEFKKVSEPADVSTTFDKFVSDSFAEPEATLVTKILKIAIVKKILDAVTPYLDEYAPFVYNIDGNIWLIILCIIGVLIIYLILSSLFGSGSDSNSSLQSDQFTQMMMQRAAMRRMMMY